MSTFIWEKKEEQERVRQFVKDNPALANEFGKRVLQLDGEDRNYRYQFLKEIEGERTIRYVTRAHILADHEKKELVDRLSQIRWLNCRKAELESDENAALVLAVGEILAPYLVEKITDTTPSKWLTWATVGDVADNLLSQIYEKPAQLEFIEIKNPGNNCYINYLEFHNTLVQEQFI